MILGYVLRIAVCDNNEPALDYLCQCLVELYGSNFHIEKFSKADDLLDRLLDTAFDILLLDINLGSHNGVEIAKQIKERHSHIKIIFITGYIYYARDIFEAEPTYFLVKPVDTLSVKKAIDKALEKIENEKSHTITISSKGAVERVATGSILYMESKGRVVRIYEGKNTYSIYAILDELEKKLPNHFVRCHQSFIVNMKMVRHMGKQSFQLRNGDSVPISQRRYKQTKSTFLKYLGEEIQ